MAEIEINALSRQCLGSRTPEHGAMDRKVSAWQRHRNLSAKPLDWMF